MTERDPDAPEPEEPQPEPEGEDEGEDKPFRPNHDNVAGEQQES